MQFDTTYWHSMDRQAAQNLEVSPAQIGISTNIAKDQLQGLKSRIFAGAQAVELGFAGQGKGFLSQGATTPGMYGKEEREAMREMAKVNKVKLSTHASVNVMGTSGLTQHGFDEESREVAINEIKRAVDFAADVTEGGAVTIHTAEFPRPISEQEYGKEFTAYPEEENRATLLLIDKHTGEVINAIKKDQEIYAPAWETDPATGKDLRDENGRRIPKWDEEEKEFMLEKRNYNYYLDEANKWNEEHKADIEKDPSKKKTPSVMMFHDTMDMRAGYNRAYSRIHSHEAEEYLKYKEKIEKALKLYEKIESDIPEEEKWTLKRQFGETFGGLVPPETKSPSEYLKEQMYRITKKIENDRDMAVSLMEQAKEIEQKIERSQPIERYAIEKSADSLARLGIYAMDKTRAQKLEKPLFISPENIDIRGPGYGGYGSHPSELKELILKSREAMARKLMDERRISKNQAEEYANEHIKATFDVGHAYTWKKFFKWAPGETAEQHKKRFDTWLMSEVDKLNKAGIIGKVHLSDNFGYYDEHTTPGQADVPLKEFVQKMKKAGYKEPMIVEPAHQEQQVMLDAWKTLESPVYKIDLTSKSWTDIQGSYFGKTHAPSYMVGEGVVPDIKEWTLWSGVPLE